MRRPGLAGKASGTTIAGCAWAALAIIGGAGPLASLHCVHAPVCDGLQCPSACPRNASMGPGERCACAGADVLILGACVPPPVAKAFCGPSSTVARAGDTGDACAFRACDPGESLDVVSGKCVRSPALSGWGAIACPPPSVTIVENGQVECALPQAACPRGTTPGGGVCVQPPTCPAGTLAEGPSCRAVVEAGGRTRGPTGAPWLRVDVGAWTALVLGIDGGQGAASLCSPLAQRPSLFAMDLADAADLTDLKQGSAVAGADPGANAGNCLARSGRKIRLAISAVFPDEDVSRLHVEVHTRDARGRELSGAADAAVESAVSSLFETLRGLGGEASAASLEVTVTCAVLPCR